MAIISSRLVGRLLQNEFGFDVLTARQLDQADPIR
jgi:hypothetical protein